MQDIMLDVFFINIILICSILILGIVSFSLISIGSKVVLKKKPLLIHSKLLFILTFLGLSLVIIPTLIAVVYSKELKTFEILNPILIIFTIVVIWIKMRGYAVYAVIGITEKSFREAIFAALKEQNLEWREVARLIHIPSENLDIKVSTQSWMGTGQLQNKTKQKNEVFEKIIGGIKKEFSAGNADMNNTISIFFIIMGIIMLVMAGGFLAMLGMFSSSLAN
jgi:hypothetical protein